ncbi:hypothetical protein CcaverHIS002_0406700 [Cutaneotrichosporon cavernicola]|nr:hypothetical protein CcaverHIS002_0406700 [Cutaneotrichosporon cavernicola]
MRAVLLLLFAGYAVAQGAGPPGPVPTSTSSSAAAPTAAPPPSSNSQAAPPTQTTPQNQESTPVAQSSAPPTTTSFSGPATFVFASIATATQCVGAGIRWDLRNADKTKYAVDMYAFNIGVDQSIPPAPSPSSSAATPANTPAAQPSSSNNATPAANTPNAAPAASAASPAAPAAPANPNPQSSNPPTTQAVAGGGAAAPPAKRAFGPLDHVNPMVRDKHVQLVARANINATVVKGWRTNIPYDWVVDVPPGRYRILAIVNDEARTWAESAPFTVIAGTNTTCVKDTPDASNSVSSGAPGKTSGAAGSGSEEAGSKKSGLSGGAIAGVVIGVLAGVALAILAFICFRKAARDKRRDAGGREPQTPMRNLIGEPTDFRKTKGARASMGHALAAIGIGANRGGGVERAERGEKPLFPAVPRMSMGNRRGSDMTTGTDNPFETAPTTPVEEKTPSHTPGSSFGTSIPPASALAAGAAAREERDNHLCPPRSPPRGVYDGIDDEPDTFRPSTPTPMRLPPSQVPANLAPSSVGTSPPGGSPVGTGPNTPVTPGFAGRASHLSRPSAGSLHDAVDTPTTTTTPSVLPPSAFPATPSSPPRVVERKTSTRRKPVPRLTDEDVESPTQAATSSQGHTSDSSPERALKLPETKPIGGGPAGDEFGLNAALAGIEHSQSFTLMPDPPLQQNDQR